MPGYKIVILRLNKLMCCFAVVAAWCLAGCSQKGERSAIAIAFYNCENFFDPADDPAKEDEDFTPAGKYHYTQKIYEQKLHNIATVIQGMNGGPAVAGLAEVENTTVLSDLVRQPEIRRKGYRYIWYNGPDPRGINVALLYDPSFFKVISSEAVHIDISVVEPDALTRDVLHVYGILSGDTVHLLVNHWPSRRGATAESSAKRDIAAGVNKRIIFEIMKKEPDAKIILLGDLNDNLTDHSIAGTLGAKSEQGGVAATELYDPWAQLYKNGAGTEVYKHNWNLFDQIIISGGLLANKNRKLQYSRAEVFKPDFITDHYKGHEGEPHRSFAGTRWINGYSDHFPVILYLSGENKAKN